MAKREVLVVEDEEDILELVRYHLSREGFEVATATNGEDAVRTAQRRPPDLVLLDLMLPHLDGLEVCRRLKRDPKTAAVPVIMLTAKGDEADIVAGLELGAEDYVTKPFSIRVLLARVRAVLRRRAAPAEAAEAVVRAHGIVITPARHEVLLRGKPLDLTFSEFRILHHLATHPGWVMTREQIVNAIHGESYPVTDRAVDVQIVGLRRKLGPAADCIETVRGVGYRFRE